MPDPDPYRRFAQRRAAAEAAAREADQVMAEAGVVYAPASARPAPPKKAPADPAPLVLRALVRLVGMAGGPDRLVTWPVWVLWAATVHLTLVVLLVGLTAAGAAVMAVYLRLALPGWAAAAVAVPAALLSVAGTAVDLWRSFRRLLADFPW